MYLWSSIILYVILVDAKATPQLSEDNTPNLIVDGNNEDNTNTFKTEITPHIRHKEFKKKHDRFLEKPLFDVNLKYCPRPATCQVLNYTSCMGAKLPYHFTTLNLTDLNTQDEVQEKLHLYQYLRYIPKCWAVIQPFLCALYMPKCEKGMVDLPSREMCKVTLGPCKVLYNSSVFPEFLNCEDDRLFPSKCKNDVQELKFNTTGMCLDPLVKTDQQDWYYPDIEGCGLRCKDSLYTENEHYQIHKLVAYCVILCIFLNLLTIMTFVIDWRPANKYPALAIFYVNVCFFISYCGWLIQFLGSETREDVVCKKDGTLRKSEPSATENLSCVIVFVMVYYFLIAGLVWFVIFSYAWYMSSLQALGKSQERVNKKRAYFHLVAWSLPLILTITTMAIGEIDGDYVTGVCFVGFVNTAARIGLLLTPLAAAMIVSGYIIVRGLILLVKVNIDSKEIITDHSRKKIRSNIVRMGVFAFFMIMFCVITFAYHSYIAVNTSLWKASLNDFILCKLTSFSSDFSHCKQEVRPSVAMLQLQLLAVFGTGIGMASWVWCDATITAWASYVKRKFHCGTEEPVKLPKHTIIAKIYDKRKEFNGGDKISISAQRDLVGLDIHLNSAGSFSNNISSTWVANIARFVNRRDALPNEAACSMSSNHHSSEVSLSVRHLSIESRRNSGDSQLSVHMSELKATRKAHRSRRKPKHGYRGNYGRSGNKRESTTSLDSCLQMLDIFRTNGDEKPCLPNLNRRTGNAGLDGHQIPDFLSKNVPFGRNLLSGSEDENVSVTISEGKFNMVCSRNKNFDLEDRLLVQSLHRGGGPHIEEVSSSSDTDGTRNKDHGQEKRYSRSGKESHSSKRSKHSRKSKTKYSSNSDDYEDNSRNSDSSSCQEIKKLVQSSLNSGVSVGCEKNRGSRQSKTSNDVAVQANAHDIVTQTAAYDLEMQNLRKAEEHDNHKSKHTKTKENKKYRRASKNYEINDSQNKHKKDKYINCGSPEERKMLRRDSNRKYSDLSDEERLLKEKNKINIRISKEGA